jgi:hypothetical protein
MTEVPWGSLFGLLFMTMGPIRAVSVYSRVGDSEAAPGARALATRSARKARREVRGLRNPRFIITWRNMAQASSRRADWLIALRMRWSLAQRLLGLRVAPPRHRATGSSG